MCIPSATSGPRTGETRTALIVLVSGRFRIDFPHRSVVLCEQGDYVVFDGVDHSWYAEEDSVILGVRWPSVPGYAVPEESPNRRYLIGVIRGMISASLSRRAATAAFLLSTGLLVAACGVKSQAAAPTTTVTVTVSPSAHATTTQGSQPSSTSASPSASTTADGPRPCPTRYLSAKVGPLGAAAGSVYTTIDFTNISNITCTLYGYPGIVLAGGSPVSPIGLSAAEDPATPRQLVTLAPKAVASARLRIAEAANFPPQRCHPTKATYLQVIPPNQRTPIFLRYDAMACARPVNILTIDVVKPGPGNA